MRTIKELLILLREKLPEYISLFGAGSICWTITEMWDEDDITDDEWNLLERYIEEKRPDNASNHIYKNGDYNGFWWPYGELQPRLEFLDKLISEYEN